MGWFSNLFKWKPKTAPFIRGPDLEHGFDKNRLMKLRSRMLQLPAAGCFVQESHYLTDKDFYLLASRYPKDIGEQIYAHIKRSIEFMLDNYPNIGVPELDPLNKIYNNKYKTQWTPSEGGKIGQAARGDHFPTIEQEIWQGNMMFIYQHMPAPGTKYLITNPSNGLKCVIQMGFEIGPGNEKDFIGGVTTEVHWYLKADNKTQLVIDYCDDQSVKLGPVI